MKNYHVKLFKDVEDFEQFLNDNPTLRLHSWVERVERDGGHIVAVFTE